MITGVIEASSRGIWSRTATALAVSLALGICSSVPLAAQTATTGVVLGKVTDPSGRIGGRSGSGLDRHDDQPDAHAADQ